MAALIELFNTDHQSLVDWICKEYGLGSQAVQLNNEHRVRREKIATRLKLYRDQVDKPLRDVIDQVYQTVEMQEALKRFIGVSVGQNVTRRIVNEISTLYDRPALRVLKERDDEFHVEEARMGLHFIHQEALRLTNLCNEVLLWQFKGVDEKRTLRIVTPDVFDAVPDPRDRLVPAGYVIDFAPVSVLPDRDKLTHWQLWDDTYLYLISGEGRLVDAYGNITTEPIAHGLGRIPGVLFHRRQPTTCILDASYGEDIKSTHLAVALLDLMIMRLSKTQGERQPVLGGNLAAMVKGQVMDGERPIALPPDVVMSMLEMKTDPDHYLAVKKDKLTSCALTYGMSYEQYSHTGDASSGKAYQVRREKLTELRIEQRNRSRAHEAMVIELIGFDPTDMRLDFQEQAIPLDAMEALELLDKKMRMGLASPIDWLQQEDTDLSREDAITKISVNLRDFALLMLQVRALNISGNADAANPGKSPQENGATGGRPADNTETDYDALAKEILDAA